MRFDSYQFAIFFPLVVGLFWSLPQRFRWVLLLISSYYFYMCWRPPYALVLVGLTSLDFCVGLALARVVDLRARRAVLFASLAANLGILFVFKYYPFVVRTLSEYDTRHLFPELALVLPIGLSFHTFQSMGYAIDVYHRKVPPERHLGRFATFIVFFPQLVAGPIERAGEMLPQLRWFPNFEYARVTNGLKLMAWGLFKKVVIADRLARLVDPVYAHPESHSGALLALATVAFGYQIYCDFSGYTDIAIGSAEVLGVHLRQNFRAPYHSRSIREFWTRWHISLSTWFRDYLYVPLGGNRVSPVRWAFNILVVFLLSGLWHGANWTFVAWGLYHGVLMILGRLTDGARFTVGRLAGVQRWPRALFAFHLVSTFLLVNVGWIWFRALDMHTARTIFERIATDWQSFLLPTAILQPMARHGWSTRDTVIVLLALAVLETVDTIGLRIPLRPWLSRRNFAVRWCAYYALALSIALCGRFGGPPFIYFQF